jgi:hypothetical protein
MQVWVNGVLQPVSVNGAMQNYYSGPTLYTGYGVYLKLANYHSANGWAMSVSHDRVVSGTTWDQVSLSRLEGLIKITSPVAGTTVSGTINVTATDSAAFPVVGVQFKYDGINNIGVEDTVAPYAVSADTTTVANGWYWLTAVSRDAAGNLITSAPVSIFVSN